nr:MAG TPA: 50S ribosomal subunit [Caudoviricetes sp.]
MNKYQDSLDNFVKALSHFTKFKSIHDWKSDLQELVDRATPKKPIQKAAGRTVCPNCERSIAREVSPRYCIVCGQRLDWSEE